MDIPNCATNIYKLDGVKTVSWALYSLAESYYNSEQGLTVNAEEKDANERGLLDLEKCTNELRGSKYHVLLDDIRLDIWVFSFSEHERSATEALIPAKRISEITEQYGFIKAKEGLLELSSNATASMQSSIIPPKGPIVQFFELKPKVTDVPRQPSKASIVAESTQSELMPYDMFKRLDEALSMSIMRLLTKDNYCLPIGRRECIYDPAPPTYAAHESFSSVESESVLDDQIHDLALISLRFQILAVGALIFSIVISPLPGFELLYCDGVGRNPNFEPVGREVILIPSGLVALVVDHASDVLSDIKDSTITRLAQHGLVCPAKSPWLRLRLIVNDIRRVIAWPAALCLSRAIRSNHTQAPNAKNLIFEGDPRADPLLRAEEWFNARSDRAEILATLRKKKEKASSLQKQDNDVENDDFLYDDDFNYIANHAIAQDVTGIYPTPPDGPPSHPYIPSTVAPPDTYGSVEGTIAIPASASGTSPAVPSPNRERDHGRYEENSNGSLFGDVDADLFASNGLTEADFNFFDEPSPEYTVGTQQVQRSRSPSVMSVLMEPGAPEEDVMSIASSVSYPEATIEEPKKDAILRVSEAEDSRSQVSLKLSSHLDPDSMLPLVLPQQHATQDAAVRRDLSTMTEEPRQGAFGQIPFRSSLNDFDAKYAEAGRFVSGRGNVLKGERPTAPSLQRRFSIPRLRAPASARDRARESEVTDLDSGDESDKESETSQTSWMSEVRSLPPTENGHQSHVLTARKRKFEETDNNRGPTTPARSCSNATPSPEELEEIQPLAPTELFVLQATSLLEGALSSSGGMKPRVYRPDGLDPKDFLLIAQLLIEQEIIHNHEYLSGLQPRSKTISSHSADTASLIESKIFLNLSQIWPSVSPCSLQEFLSIGQSHTAQQSSRPNQPQNTMKRPSSIRSSKGSADDLARSFRIEPPTVCLKRGDASIDVAISSLRFWEELSFAPICGVKNVHAVCLLPASNFLQEQAISFLSTLGSTYQSLKLGEHTPCTLKDDKVDSFKPVKMGVNNIDTAMRDISDACEETGRKLAVSGCTGVNYVVYIINAFDEPAAIPQICEAFSRLFDAYAVTIRAKRIQQPNELVLQIVPLSLIASSETIIIPTPSLYKKLAFEIYSRCAPGDRTNLTPFSCAPAIHLAKSIPRQINFQLTSKPIDGSPLSDRCIHVAYCFSSGSPWLTASWVDSHGCLQWNAPYYLTGGLEESWAQFSYVAEEIWESTLEIANARCTPSRVFLAKSGNMDKEEYNTWISLANRSQNHVLLTLLTIEADPSLRIPRNALPSMPTKTPLATPTAAAFSSDLSASIASVSTPGMINASANPTTPTLASFESDSDARLIDVTEETWGLVMNNAITALNANPEVSVPLFNGFLMKRQSAHDQDGLLTCEVNLLYSQRPCEALLKEVLGMYSSLATLARIRNIVDPIKSILPVHVAAAIKAHAALHHTMCWTDD